MSGGEQLEHTSGSISPSGPGVSAGATRRMCGARRAAAAATGLVAQAQHAPHASTAAMNLPGWARPGPSALAGPLVCAPRAWSHSAIPLPPTHLAVKTLRRTTCSSHHIAPPPGNISGTRGSFRGLRPYSADGATDAGAGRPSLWATPGRVSAVMAFALRTPERGRGTQQRTPRGTDDLLRPGAVGAAPSTAVMRGPCTGSAYQGRPAGAELFGHRTHELAAHCLGIVAARNPD